jgi:hypothetical protein
MEIAAGIVGCVSLSGQVLQGCTYLCNFFADASDAHELIVTVSIELGAVRSRLQAFQVLLLEVQAISPASLTVQQDPAVLLKICQDAIQKLQAFLDKYADLSVSTQLGSASSQVRRAWHKLDVARRGAQLRNHISQLEAAKSSLLAAQTSIQFALELKQLNESREGQRDLQQLRDEHAASAEVVKDTRTLATNIRTSQEESRRLTALTHTSLDQVVSNTQTLLERSTLSDQSSHNAEVASKFTQDAITALSTDFKKGFENLPAMLAPVIANTITKSLAQHNASEQAGLVSRAQPRGDMSTKVRNGSAYHDICSLPRRNSSESAPQRDQSAPSTTHVDLPPVPTRSTIYTEHLIHSAQPSRRSPKRQQTRKSVFNVWFGRIEIKTSVTEQEDDVGSDHGLPMRLQARRTSFKLLPSLWFLKTGLLFELGNSRPTVSHPGWDNRLYVIRTHLEDSAVVRTIEGGDYVGFRQLLERREITPFDLVQGYSHGSAPLFGKVVVSFANDIIHRNLMRQKGLLDIARLLADCGVDCGLGFSLCTVLASAADNPNDLVLTLFRIIMTQSQSDPFEASGGMVASSLRNFEFSLLMKQNEWDLSEFRSLFQHHCGNGAFQYLVENEGDRAVWSGLQLQKWRQKPAAVRRSRSYCSAEFGSTFVNKFWGELCWLDERPAFWQSRQACEDAFGHQFAQYHWPKLYWKEQLPTFWHSRKACLEEFGEHFVQCKWPDLYWTEELPTFWHSRSACLEEFGELFVQYKWPAHLGETCFEFLEGNGAWERSRAKRMRCWDDYGRNAWITLMMNCWSKEDATLRHSRRHCIDGYGTNFVQYELPSLLREDGLGEEEILRLTNYGLDMEPPPPCPDWKNKSRSDSAHQEFGDYEVECEGESEGERESEPDFESEFDGEISDGWQTADEDLSQQLRSLSRHSWSPHTSKASAELKRHPMCGSKPFLPCPATSPLPQMNSRLSNQRKKLGAYTFSTLSFKHDPTEGYEDVKAMTADQDDAVDGNGSLKAATFTVQTAT